MSRISDMLISILRQRFPSMEIRQGTLQGQPTVTIRAVNPEVGDVQIWDDGKELIVGIGRITHGHFNTRDESLNDAETARLICNDVVAFLSELFADRVELWCAGGAGGWHRRGETELPPLPRGGRKYVWSGPIRERFALRRPSLFEFLTRCFSEPRH